MRTESICLSCFADDHGVCPLVVHVYYRLMPDNTYRGGTFICGCECRKYVIGPRWDEYIKDG